MASSSSVIVVDPQQVTSRSEFASGRWPSDLEIQCYSDPDKAITALQRLADRGRPPAAVVLFGEPKAALHAARQVHRQDPLVQMIFRADQPGARQLREEMGLAPRIGTHWTIADPATDELPRRLREAVRATEQRRQLRTTLDRARLQLASSPPPADASDYRRLVLSDRYLAAILTHARDAILSTDPGGNILTANPATERLTGHPQHALLSQTLPALAVDQQAAEVGRLLQAVREGAPEVRRELRVRRSGGGAVDVDMMLAPIRDENERLLGTSAILRDITERKAAEQKLREQREWLQVTLSSIGDAVIATDARGHITFLNPVAEALTGWNRQEVVGQPLETVFTILNEHTRETVANPVGKVLREDAVVGLANHTILVARDATERPIEDSAAPIRDRDGRILGVVLVFHDVSQRRQFERELQKRAEGLADADRRKDEFLALLGHELRNPLSPLRHGLDVLQLQEEMDVALAGEIHAMMSRQVDQLVHLVDDLLDVSRISRGLLKLRRQHVELSELLTRAVEATRPDIEERQHELVIHPPEQPLWINVDPVRLEQILCNLLTNASRYTERGGHIRVTAERDGAWAAIRVADTGIGIRPEMLAQIFEVFIQADRTTGSVQEGLGLGLKLVKSLTDMHGGKVEAHSAGPGTGSEFVVRFPVLGESSSRDISSTAPAPLR